MSNDQIDPLLDEGGEPRIHYSTPFFNVNDFTRVKNAALILETLMERGSNTKNKTLLHTFNSGSRGRCLFDELIEIGAIEKTQLRGDRNWVNISPKGRRIVKQWRHFIASFNGE